MHNIAFILVFFIGSFTIQAQNNFSRETDTLVINSNLTATTLDGNHQFKLFKGEIHEIIGTNSKGVFIKIGMDTLFIKFIKGPNYYRISNIRYDILKNIKYKNIQIQKSKENSIEMIHFDVTDFKVNNKVDTIFICKKDTVIPLIDKKDVDLYHGFL